MQNENTITFLDDLIQKSITRKVQEEAKKLVNSMWRKLDDYNLHF